MSLVAICAPLQCFRFCLCFLVLAKPLNILTSKTSDSSSSHTYFLLLIKSRNSCDPTEPEKGKEARRKLYQNPASLLEGRTGLVIQGVSGCCAYSHLKGKKRRSEASKEALQFPYRSDLSVSPVTCPFQCCCVTKS